MLNISVTPAPPLKEPNEIWEYLLKDCGAHVFPFIIENEHSTDENYEDWDSYILVTSAIKDINKKQFDCQYTVLKGKHFGKVTISKDAVWKFSRATLQISNKIT